MKRCLLLATLLLAGCFPPRVDTIDLSTLSPAERVAAAKVRVLPPGAPIAADADYLGPVEGFSCKHLLWDPPASESAALEQMRVRALRMGATAVADFTCTASGTDAYGTNCWNAVQCGGTAVRVR